MAVPAAYRLVLGGVAVRVRLTPRASTDRVEGACDSADGPAFAARVRAVPSDGEANAALERLIADWLGLAKSCVALTAGQKSRIKTVTITGDSEAVLERLADLSDTKSKKS